MQVSTTTLLNSARACGYAIGAFNVYNLEGVLAVIAAAEAEASPAMLQFHPASLRSGGAALVGACMAAAIASKVPVAVHLDHSSAEGEIRAALEAGAGSVMADGSALPYESNVQFTRAMSTLAHSSGAVIEAELGRLSGSEDGTSVSEREAKMTDPEQAARFVRDTGVDALAVCIGNVHGKYPGEPRLDFARLETLRNRVPVPLVLHGASGLPGSMIRRSIELGVAKFNVNTEVRQAYMASLRSCTAAERALELADLMLATTAAMSAVVREKLRIFGSSGMAERFAAPASSRDGKEGNR
jgi:tagatose 1,6-diphosphate aldolase GatY/KbaY